MKTTVIMKRELLGGQISQNSKTEMLSATDLVAIGNKWRIVNGLPIFNMSNWLSTKSTKEFVNELELRYGKENVRKASRGKNSHTWLHPVLFIDLALAINPKIKIEVYEWLFDQLIKNRNESGNSYKEMCGALFVRASRKDGFHRYIQEVAKKIRLACNVVDWQEASQEQLKLRDKLHNDIALLSDVLNNNDEAVRLAITKNLDLKKLQ